MPKYIITDKGKKFIAKGTEAIKSVQRIIKDNELSVAEVAGKLKMHPRLAKTIISALHAQGYIKKKE